jgi:hypothetical protein
VELFVHGQCELNVPHRALQPPPLYAPEISLLSKPLHGLVISHHARAFVDRQRGLLESGVDLVLAAQSGAESESTAERVVCFRQRDWAAPSINVSYSVGPRLPRGSALLPTLSTKFQLDDRAPPAIVAVGRTSDGLYAHDYTAGARAMVRSGAPILRGLPALIRWPEDGPADVSLLAVLSGTPPELAFTRTRIAGGNPGDLAMRTIATMRPGWVGAQTTLGSWRLGSPMIVASAANGGGATIVTLLVISESGNIVARAETRASRMTAIGPIAVAIDATGEIGITIAGREAGRSAGPLRFIRASSNLLLDRVEVTGISPPLEVQGLVRDIRIEYDRSQTMLAAVALIRMSDGVTHFYDAGGGLRRAAVRLAEFEEIALLGLQNGWQLLVNDGCTLRREILVER